MQSFKGPELAWFFSQIDSKGKTFSKGDTVTVQILRAGKWDHPEYGEVKITPKTIDDVVRHFKQRDRGIDLCVDENHDPDHKALGWFREVYADAGCQNCWAKFTLTQKGADLLNEGAYKYFSPEISFHKVDEESGKPLKNLLLGGALTNRPFFKGMQPLMASESPPSKQQTGTRASHQQHAYFFSDSTTMHKLMLKLDKFAQRGTALTASEKAELEGMFAEIPEGDRNAAFTQEFNDIMQKFAGDDMPPPAKGKKAPPAKAKKSADDDEDKEDDTVAADEEDGEEDGDVSEDDKDVDEKIAELEQEIAELKQAQEKDEEDDEDGDDEEDSEKEEYAADESDEEDDEEETPPAKGKKGKAPPMKMSEDGKNFIIPKSQFAEMRKNLDRAEHELRFGETIKKVRTLKFNEKTKKGVLLGRHVKKFTDFALKLNKQNAAEFFELISSLKPFTPEQFSEIGHGLDLNRDKTDPTSFSENDAEVQFYMESMGMELDAAKNAAARAAKNKKGA